MFARPDHCGLALPQEHSSYGRANTGRQLPVSKTCGRLVGVTVVSISSGDACSKVHVENTQVGRLVVSSGTSPCLPRLSSL